MSCMGEWANLVILHCIMWIFPWIRVLITHECILWFGPCAPLAAHTHAHCPNSSGLQFADQKLKMSLLKINFVLTRKKRKLALQECNRSDAEIEN